MPTCSPIDVDGDGKADIVCSCAHQFGIWWYQQRPGTNGSPSFVKHDLFPKLVSETHALHYVDIDGDGLKDLVTGKRYWSHGKHEPGSDGPAMLYWFEGPQVGRRQTTFTPYAIDNDSGIGTQFEVDRHQRRRETRHRDVEQERRLRPPTNALIRDQIKSSRRLAARARLQSAHVPRMISVWPLL